MTPVPSTGWRSRIASAALDALGVILPVECAGCGRPDRALCSGCRAELEPSPLHRTTPGGLVVVAGLRYEGVARRVILALKDADRTELAGSLAPALTVALARLRGDRGTAAAAGTCPVPPSRASWRRRGYDPVALMLRRAGLPAPRLLRTARTTSVQKSLGRAERAANTVGALRARRPLDGRRVVLVDDVVTTGATLDEAARAVRAAGGEVVGAVVVASTPRLGRRPAPLTRDRQ